MNSAMKDKEDFSIDQDSSDYKDYKRGKEADIRKRKRKSNQ